MREDIHYHQLQSCVLLALLTTRKAAWYIILVVSASLSMVRLSLVSCRVCHIIIIIFYFPAQHMLLNITNDNL